MRYLSYHSDGKKTVIQVFGVENPDLEMDGITFGGCTLKHSPQFTHLGLEAMNDLTQTQSKNVHIKITV